MSNITRDEIVQALIALGYQAEKKESMKNGVVHEGILIQNESPISPVIYTKRLIEEAERQDLCLLDVVAKVVKSYEEAKSPEFNERKLLDRDFILDNLFIGLQKDSTEQLVRGECMLDGIESYLYVGGDFEDDGTYSLKVTEAYLDYTDISIEDAWDRAKRNTFSKTVIQSLAQLMAELCNIPYDPSMEIGLPMYVISTRDRVKGASTILDQEAVAAFAREQGVDKLIVLPSSVHEMILVPYEPDMDLAACSEMVRSINQDEVEPEERLTDRAYLIEI